MIVNIYAMWCHNFLGKMSLLFLFKFDFFSLSISITIALCLSFIDIHIAFYSLASCSSFSFLIFLYIQLKILLILIFHSFLFFSSCVCFILRNFKGSDKNLWIMLRDLCFCFLFTLFCFLMFKWEFMDFWRILSIKIDSLEINVREVLC